MKDILQALNDDVIVRRQIRYADTTFLVKAGDREWNLAFQNGKVAEAKNIEPKFKIVIDAEAWAAFSRPVPPPGFHELAAMAQFGRAKVTGDFTPLIRYYFSVRNVLSQLAKGSLCA